MRQRLIRLLVWLAAATAHTVLHSTPGQPNILLIFADDIGYEWLEAQGGPPNITPELDQMATQGVLFTRAYTSPVCTPSRVSLHTGTYTCDHKHTSVLTVHEGTTEAVDFVKQPTFAQLLRAGGYSTSVTGKWQLATLYHHPDHPKVAGFDSWCLWQIWDGRKQQKTTRYSNPAINRDGFLLSGETLLIDTISPTGETLLAGTMLPNVTDKFGPDVLNDYVKERMTTATKANQPFFILHNMMLPHTPIIAPPGGTESLESMIHYMDALVGDLLDKIEALGIREKTYVFFIGDNGTESKVSRQTKAGAVTGGKRNLNDAGTHVPFIVWGPPAIPPGSVVTDLVDITDVFPTICELAKINVPENIPLRGRSIVPQIQGELGNPRPWVHGGISNGQSVFDGEWRLIKDGDKTVLIDSRHLPNERRTTSPQTEEEIAALEKLEAILAGLQPPSPSSD